MSEQTITEFLLARIEEDETVAKATESSTFIAYVDDSDWHIEAESVSHLANFGRTSWPLVAQQVAHIARHDPARVLAECAAKRAIVERHSEGWAACRWTNDDGDHQDGETCDELRHLAAVYADHADYNPEWKP